MPTAIPVKLLLGSVWLSSVLALGCESGGVGDPCTPEEEYLPGFSGFDVGEVSVQSRSYECLTRVCLVNKFQGRVSCPYGSNGTEFQPGSTATVDHNFQCQVPNEVPGTYTSVAVVPQLIDRPPEDAVYCSCRCSGPDPNARYCECPSGFECADIGLTNNAALSGDELTGNYCVRAGTNVDPNTLRPLPCSLPAAGQPPNADELTCGSPPAEATN